MLTDARRGMVLVNPAFTEITGYELQEVKGKLARLLWSKRHDGTFSAAVWTAVEAGNGRARSGSGAKAARSARWMNISVVRDAAGAIVNHVSVFSDITAIKDAEERLNYLAYHDRLRICPTACCWQTGTHCVQPGRTIRRPVALLYLDLDHKNA